MNTSLNLPLSDRAGRGELEHQIQSLVRDMVKATNFGHRHEFEYLSKKLDAARAKFHHLYNVKEHATEAPLKHG